MMMMDTEEDDDFNLDEELQLEQEMFEEEQEHMLDTGLAGEDLDGPPPPSPTDEEGGSVVGPGARVAPVGNCDDDEEEEEGVEEGADSGGSDIDSDEEEQRRWRVRQQQHNTIRPDRGTDRRDVGLFLSGNQQPQAVVLSRGLEDMELDSETGGDDQAAGGQIPEGDPLTNLDVFVDLYIYAAKMINADVNVDVLKDPARGDRAKAMMHASFNSIYESQVALGVDSENSNSAARKGIHPSAVQDRLGRVYLHCAFQTLGHFKDIEDASVWENLPLLQWFYENNHLPRYGENSSALEAEEARELRDAPEPPPVEEPEEHSNFDGGGGGGGGFDFAGYGDRDFEEEQAPSGPVQVGIGNDGGGGGDSDPINTGLFSEDVELMVDVPPPGVNHMVPVSSDFIDVRWAFISAGASGGVMEDVLEEAESIAVQAYKETHNSYPIKQNDYMSNYPRWKYNDTPEMRAFLADVVRRAFIYVNNACATAGYRSFKSVQMQSAMAVTREVPLPSAPLRRRPPVAGLAQPPPSANAQGFNMPGAFAPMAAPSPSGFAAQPPPAVSSGPGSGGVDPRTGRPFPPFREEGRITVGNVMRECGAHEVFRQNNSFRMEGDIRKEVGLRMSRLDDSKGIRRQRDSNNRRVYKEIDRSDIERFVAEVMQEKGLPALRAVRG